MVEREYFKICGWWLNWSGDSMLFFVNIVIGNRLNVK